MASIKENRNKAGEIVSYRVRLCVGRDERYRQIWRTTTLPRPEGLTPARERKAVELAAAEWEAKVKKDADNDMAADKDKITLKKFVSDWLNEHVDNGKHSPNGKRFFAYTSDIIIEYYGGHTRLSEINLKSIKKFLKWLRVDKGYSEATQQHCLGTLKNVLGYAVRTGYLERNPTDNLTQADKPTLPPKEVDYLTPDEARAFLTALQDEPVMWRAFFTALLYTGMRRGELLAVQWRDYDTVRQELHVCKSVSVADAGADTKTVVKSTKTGYDRYCPVVSELAATLEEWRRETERLYGSVEPDAFIFSAQRNTKEPMYVTSVNRWLARFQQRRGLRHFSVHCLRHSAASLALESGCDLKQISKLLGHHSIQVTLDYYAGVNAERTRRAAEGIGSLLKGAQTPTDAPKA